MVAVNLQRRWGLGGGRLWIEIKMLFSVLVGQSLNCFCSLVFSFSKRMCHVGSCLSSFYHFLCNYLVRPSPSIPSILFVILFSIFFFKKKKKKKKKEANLNVPCTSSQNVGRWTDQKALNGIFLMNIMCWFRFDCNLHRSRVLRFLTFPAPYSISQCGPDILRSSSIYNNMLEFIGYIN